MRQIWLKTQSLERQTSEWTWVAVTSEYLNQNVVSILIDMLFAFTTCHSFQKSLFPLSGIF